MTKFWVCRQGEDDDSALGIALDPDADVSDLIQRACSVIAVNGCMPSELRCAVRPPGAAATCDADAALGLLSNREELGELGLAKGSVLVLVPKLAAAAKFHGAAEPSPVPSSARVAQPSAAVLAPAPSHMFQAPHQAPLQAQAPVPARNPPPASQAAAPTPTVRTPGSEYPMAQLAPSVYHTPTPARAAQRTSPARDRSPLSSSRLFAPTASSRARHLDDSPPTAARPPLPTPVAHPSPLRRTPSGSGVPPTMHMARRPSPKQRGPSPAKGAPSRLKPSSAATPPPLRGPDLAAACTHFEPQWGAPATCGRCKQHRLHHAQPALASRHTTTRASAPRPTRASTLRSSSGQRTASPSHAAPQAPRPPTATSPPPAHPAPTLQDLAARPPGSERVPPPAAPTTASLPVAPERPPVAAHSEPEAPFPTEAPSAVAVAQLFGALPPPQAPPPQFPPQSAHMAAVLSPALGTAHVDPAPHPEPVAPTAATLAAPVDPTPSAPRGP